MPDYKTTKGKVFISCLVILTVALQYGLKYLYKFVIFGEEQYTQFSWQFKTLLIVSSGLVLCFTVVAALSKFSFRQSLEMFGFGKGFQKPLLVAFISALPSFIGFAVINGYQPISLSQIFWGSILPGLNEELVYRAFIIGILVRYCDWNFWLTLFLSSFLFAYGHIYQATGLMEKVSVFLFASGAGIGFALFYKYWNWNIWFPIFMHVFMNLSFVLFVREGNILLNGTENIFRFLTLAIAIAITIYLSVKEKKAEKKIS